MNRTELSDVPDAEEVNGAAFGIARLHSLYDLNTESLVKQGIIESKFNLNNIVSEPSVKKLSSGQLVFSILTY